MADNKFHDNDIMDAECLKLFSPSNKMTEKQLNRAMDYLNNLLQKPVQEIMKNPVQVIVLLKYMEDDTITQEQKKKILGKENYDFWKTLLEEKKKAEEKLTSEEIRKSNPNLKVEANDNANETDETEEIKMEEKKEEMKEEKKEKNFLDKTSVKLALVFGGGVVIGSVGKTVYDAWSSKGSIVTDTVESVSEFAEEFC
jgi:hypothetical protein